MSKRGRGTPSSRSSRQGYTLVELLTVIAIIAVIAGILFSVMIISKSRGKEGVEMSNLRQLGVAGAMYHDQYNEWPLTTKYLVAANSAMQSVVTSPLDESPTGLANELADKVHTDCPACDVTTTNYRRTFIGPEDFGQAGRIFTEDIEPYPDAGWLVCLTRSKPGRENSYSDRFMNPVGPYLRLLLSGAVVERHHRNVKTGFGDSYAMQFMFADGDDQWRRRLVAAP